MHFILLAITKNGTKQEIEELMKPYFEYEGFKSEEEMKKIPYCEFKVFCSVKSAHALFIIHNKKMLKKYKERKDEWYLKHVYGSEEEYITEYENCHIENGYWGYWTNTNSFWDWYQIGGRWAGNIKTKNGKGQKGLKNDEYPWNDGENPYELKKGFDGSKVKKIENLNELDLFGILDENGYYPEEKWNGNSKKYDKHENFEKFKNEYLENLDSKLHATLVDYHS